MMRCGTAPAAGGRGGGRPSAGSPSGLTEKFAHFRSASRGKRCTAF